MALLAEQIVQEWLTRQGYFTMRGLKVGNHEIDLLAAKYNDQKWEYKHIEVQVSLRPVGYITAFTNKRIKEFNLLTTHSAKERTPEQLKAAVEDWVYKKFHHPEKVNLQKCYQTLLIGIMNLCTAL